MGFFSAFLWRPTIPIAWLDEQPRLDDALVDAIEQHRDLAAQRVINAQFRVQFRDRSIGCPEDLAETAPRGCNCAYTSTGTQGNPPSFSHPRPPERLPLTGFPSAQNGPWRIRPRIRLCKNKGENLAIFRLLRETCGDSKMQDPKNVRRPTPAIDRDGTERAEWRLFPRQCSARVRNLQVSHLPWWVFSSSIFFDFAGPDARSAPRRTPLFDSQVIPSVSERARISRSARALDPSGPRVDTGICGRALWARNQALPAARIGPARQPDAGHFVWTGSRPPAPDLGALWLRRRRASPTIEAAKVGP